MAYTPNLVTLLDQRQIKAKQVVGFQRRLHVTDTLIARLGLEKELEGHSGCVNCLEWNERGDILASGSDDLNLILWDPFNQKKLHTINTGHHGNIFSVKFLPESNDGVLVSGAADCKIRVHNVPSAETTYVCSCHIGRVKRLATIPTVPFMFWSAGEDGLVMQYDLRCPHSCSSTCTNVLINLVNHLGKGAEAKCIAINPFRPEQLAIGVNDPYVRLYDRRMIKLTTVKYPSDLSQQSVWDRLSVSADNLSHDCAQYYVAGHLPAKQNDYKKRYRNLASTYLTFSPDGTELLVNLGGEQIYLFDITKPRRLKTFDVQCLSVLASGISLESNGYKNGTSNGITQNRINFERPPTEKVVIKPLPARAEILKQRANGVFERQQYTLAINLYNEALRYAPDSSVLYGNRAAGYMKRGWDGDIYSALRDCHSALQHDPNHAKAHFRLARCLFELQWTKEALDCLQIFKAKFPSQAKVHACESLDRDIQAALSASSEKVDREEVYMSTENGNNAGSSRRHAHRRPVISEQEKIWRSSAYDYDTRFCGHCNTTTDIKEANFFGSNSQYVIAGSDDGSFFIWDRYTTNIMRVLRGDESIVNCLQPHPSYCMLATSGIDPVVRLWSPRIQDGGKDDREVTDSEDAAIANQRRMNADPLEVMLLNMGYRIRNVFETDDDAGGGGDSSDSAEVQCRPS